MFSVRADASSPLLPKLLSAQVGLLWNCSSVLPLHCWQSSSYLCRASICLASISGALLDAASLTIPQRCRPVHWALRSYKHISMGLPSPNDTPRGSNGTVLLCSDLLQNNVFHMNWSFRCRKDISWSPLLRHSHAWNSVSHITRYAMEEQSKVPSSFDEA